VADHDRPLDSDRPTELRNIVCGIADPVAVLRSVAAAAAARVERRDSMSLREVVELRLKGRVVAAPARHEEQLRVTATSPLVIEPHAIYFRVGHDQPSSHEWCPSPSHWPGPVFRNDP
jgi:hypothetical protein